MYISRKEKKTIKFTSSCWFRGSRFGFGFLLFLKFVLFFQVLPLLLLELGFIHSLSSILHDALIQPPIFLLYHHHSQLVLLILLHLSLVIIIQLIHHSYPHTHLGAFILLSLFAFTFITVRLAFLHFLLIPFFSFNF